MGESCIKEISPHSATQEPEKKAQSMSLNGQKPETKLAENHDLKNTQKSQAVSSPELKSAIENKLKPDLAGKMADAPNFNTMKEKGSNDKPIEKDEVTGKDKKNGQLKAVPDPKKTKGL